MNTATNNQVANGQAAEGRDPRGRFAKGNGGGPGNPFARQTAALRQALISTVTEENMKHVAYVLIQKAQGGDLAAIKLLFQYVLGKPAEAVNPDTLDVQEWQLLQQQSTPAGAMQAVLQGMPADAACKLTNIAWPYAVEQNLQQPLREGLAEMDQREAAGETLAATETAPAEERGRPATPKQRGERRRTSGKGTSAAGPERRCRPSPNGEIVVGVGLSGVAYPAEGDGAWPSTNGDTGEGHEKRRYPALPCPALP